MNSKNECCICMENINDTNYTLTQCGHIFHSSCIIKNVFNNGYSCPMCRFSFEENNKKNKKKYLLNENYDLTYKINISHICMFYFIIYLIFMNVLIFKLICQNKISI